MKNQDEQRQYLETARANLTKLKSQRLPTRAQATIDQVLVYLDTVLAFPDKHPQQDQNRLSALYQVSQALGASLKLDDVLEQVMDSVINLTGAERGFLILTTNPQADLNVRISRNFNQDALAHEEMDVSRSVIREALTTSQGVVTTNAQEDPRFHNQESVIMFSLRSIMCAPLLAGGNLLGVIYVDSRAQIGTFETEDLELLQAFSSQAAAAIANAQQYDRTDRFLTARLSELENLSRFSKILNTQDDLSQILATTQKWALDHTEAEKVWIAVNAENQVGEQIYKVVLGEQAGMELPLNDPIIGEVIRSSTPFIFDPKDGQPARIVTPLISEQQAFGALVAESSKEFPNEDRQFLSRLINQAAIGFSKVQLHQQINSAKKETSKFISLVAHELRIPMTAILGYSDLLNQGVMGELNDNQTNFLDVIRENVSRMNKLITDLADIHKAQSDRLQLDSFAISIPNAVGGALKTYKEQLSEKYQKVELHFAPGLPLVTGDPKRLEQVVGYLLENASMYSKKGNTIDIHAHIEGDSVQVLVKDPGIGIAPADQVMLFTQFFRSEVVEVREQKGWGLGLAVVKNLVETMGGTVGFESALGEGSAFWFTLPLA
jgi:signal transduction histidine kinase